MDPLTDFKVPLIRLLPPLTFTVKEEVIIQPTLEEQMDHFICNPQQFLKEQPILFANFFNRLDKEQRQGILSHLIYELENWKELFAEVFLSLDQSGEGNRPRDVPAGAFLVNLLGALSIRCAKKWIKHCSDELSYGDWAFFILAMEGKGMSKFALNAVVNHLDFDLSEDGYRECFEALALQTNYPDLVASLLVKILDKFFQRKKFDKIVDDFNQLSFHAQICLLDAMTSTPNKQSEIFERNSENLFLMAAWMNELFCYQKDFSVRKDTVARICDSLQEGSLTNFVRKLNEKRSKVGAYFLICLAPKNFEDFVLTVPYRIRSELLSNSLADSSSSQVLLAIKGNTNQAQCIYEEMGLNLENSDIPVDSSLTLKECYEQVLKMASVDSELASNYISFIACIPPVLIGVLARNSDQRQVLLKLAPKLSEEQLKFLVCTLSSNSFNKFMKENWTFLNNSQYLAILEILPPQKLLLFIKAKIEELKFANDDFLNNYKSLQSQIEKVEGPYVISAVYIELEEQSRKLHSLSRRPLALDYYCLKSFLQRRDLFIAFSPDNLAVLQQSIQELQKAMNYLDSKRSLFEGPHAPMNIKLSELKKCVLVEEKMGDSEELEEIDLTMVLYEGFWTLVREGTLPYLGISPHSQLGIIHPGQLTLLGIQSNEDLHLLGISPQWQHRADGLANKVKKLQGIVHSADHETQEIPGFNNLWQDFISIKLASMDLNLLCVKILQTLPLYQMELGEFRKFCLSFGQELLVFKHLNEGDRKNLITGMQELKECQKPENITFLAFDLLRVELIALRSQYPLICLQRYLVDNQNLKEAWEKFHSQKCFSLKALFERGFIKTSADILKLESTAFEFRNL